ncbi:MAG TPA: carboxypeptidase regulatory-like domain-containing protein [Bryobacteraceae bacterium]|nr:carboxypeptidase regulatory-like domain-containing protein [Bryobacteraceae bacterium]
MMAKSIFAFTCLLVLLAFGFSAFAQTTVATGSISGVVTDPSGAAVVGAKVTITNLANGQSTGFTANSDGIYNSGGLIPGEYQVTVEQPGFSTVKLKVTVQVGVTANGNVKLTIGQASQIVEVTTSAVAVNPDQATVQGVLTAQQIDELPINGRNFLDLAQLEPGVQIQDGTNFDPTKVGYSSISFGGRFGRTARIAVDGVDISDETVGTTTEDIPSSGIQEFQLSQSNLDLSNDLTSSGAVNVTTRSGTNEIHGELFYFIRDARWSAQLPHPEGIPAPYQRNQFGGRLGGPIIKNKLFFFLDYERTKQDEESPVLYPAPFSNFSGAWSAPFRENEPMARLDWNISSNVHFFYRFNYFSNLADATFFSSSFQVYKNKDYTRNHVAGLDITTGSWTHTIRFSEMHFENNIADAVVGSSLPLANLGLNLDVTNGPQTGPNLLAPQATLQHDNQVKYDGGKPLGTHFVRFGVNYNHIESGGFASFFKLAPQVVTNTSPGDIAAAAAGPFPGGASNPLNYPVELAIFGDGQGYSTEKPGLGYPAGLLGPDNRFGAYLGDTWKIHPNLTMIYGLRYVRDTGRTDSDLPGFPQLNALIPGTGGQVNQPNLNFAPQIGFAWDPKGDGKTVFRIGSGLFYENVIFNNVLFDRPLRLASGAFLATPTPCVFGQALPFAVPGGTTSVNPALCNETVGQAASGLAAAQAAYQAQIPFSLSAANPNYLVSQLNSGVNLPLGLFAPDYKTPRSLQMNAGFQRELRPGTVLTMDYLRNITTHLLLGIDQNHVGDIRYFNKSAAQAAIAATLTANGWSSIQDAINHGATMADFASNGLTSPGIDFGGVCPFSYGCAFPGLNPAAPEVPELEPIGRSVYNGLDVKLNQQARSPLPGIKNVNFQIAYSLSRFVEPGAASASSPGSFSLGDQDFVNSAIDNDHPLAYEGPSALDRTNQLSFGGVADLPGGFRTSVTAHFYSGLPLNLTVPNSGLGPGEIFRTDFTGDGTVGDLLPGTAVGEFGRGISASQLGGVIQNYNNTVAGQPTPAGQVLIANGLFTTAQLQALGAVAPTIAVPPPGQVGTGPLRDFDTRISWVHKFGERFEIEPSCGIFNLFNFANFDLPPNVLSGLLTGAAGSVNGTTQANRISNRVGLGTGVYALGAPRQIEFGMTINF